MLSTPYVNPAVLFANAVLQAADDLTAGRWNDIPNAISPVTVTADELRKFYRIRP
ncbi:MAG TPA: hypothetical protein VNH84_17245 [Candidatus Saccharimonadales bacterium]|jgi:hypothetical protein|nr:hypothetical protein [Candidatus Saccharimonadales bacterium]